MVIWSEFRMRQKGDDDHLKKAPHFTAINPVNLLSEIFGELLGICFLTFCNARFNITFYYRHWWVYPIDTT